MMMKTAQRSSEKEPVSNKDHCSTLIIMDNSLTAIQPAWKRKENSLLKGYFGFRFPWNTPPVRWAGKDEAAKAKAP